MWYNYLSRSNRKKWVEADTFNEIITGRRVDISGNGCLAVKPEGIINYLINANNDQLKHCVVDIPASFSVTTEEGLEMQIMAKSDDWLLCFSQEQAGALCV